MSISASYLPADAPREPFHTTPEASRRPRGIEVWAALRSLGRHGLAEMIESGCAHAERFATGLRDEGYEVLNEVELNQVVVSFGSAETNAAVIRAIQDAGVCWCGPTQWRGRSAMRISVSSWATTAEDVTRSPRSLRARRKSGRVRRRGYFGLMSARVDVPLAMIWPSIVRSWPSANTVRPPACSTQPSATTIPGCAAR